MDIQYLWQVIREERDIAFAAIQQQKDQPRGAYLDKAECRKKGFPSGYYVGACYITSVKNRERGIEEGNVCEATINLAGVRIAEGTHRLSTDAEILQYKKAGVERGLDLKQREAA